MHIDRGPSAARLRTALIPVCVSSYHFALWCARLRLHHHAPYITTHAFDAPSPLPALAPGSSSPATALGSISSEFTGGGRYSLHRYRPPSRENQMLFWLTDTSLRAYQVGSSALLTSFGLSMDAPSCAVDASVRERSDHATVGLSTEALLLAPGWARAEPSASSSGSRNCINRMRLKSVWFRRARSRASCTPFIPWPLCCPTDSCSDNTHRIV